jgi:undecaprenyl-diphosphatase
MLATSALAALFMAGLPAVAWPANAFDREIMEFVQDHRSPDLDRLMSNLSTQWSKQNLLLAALAITARGGEESYGATEECVKAIAVSEMIVTPLKFATNRKRPEGETSRANSSFPSSHAATAFAAAAALGHAYPRIKLPAYAAAALIGYSRIYERRHFATDVIAGACVGLLSARLSRAYLACLHVDRQRLLARLPVRVDLEGEGRGLLRVYLSARL